MNPMLAVMVAGASSGGLFLELANVVVKGLLGLQDRRDLLGFDSPCSSSTRAAAGPRSRYPVEP